MGAQLGDDPQRARTCRRNDSPDESLGPWNPNPLQDMKATWNGKVLAETDDTVVVDGNHYFPLASVDPSVLRESDTTTVCGWKGTANYWSLEVDGQTNVDAVWTYREPKEAAKEIRGRVAFWKGVTVEE